MHDDAVLSGRDEVVDAINEIVTEIEQGETDDWENTTLESFLEAFGLLVDVIENHYINTKQPLPRSAWTLVASALRGARFYE